MNIGEIYFAKYKILDIIGNGGTSKVYLAENINLGNKWAIKKANKNNDIVTLLAEPNILKNLDYYGIPKIIDIEEDEDAIYIIEEYVEGINLKDYKIKSKHIREKVLINWAFQICDILTYLHKRKPYPIIYRDLKPENIILNCAGKLKLIDFGIAREYKEDSITDTVHIGTRGYAAPEQYGVGQSDIRTDIFSFGVTFYFLLTGKNLAEPPYKIQSIIQFNNDISTEFEAIILKCCEILPDKRYQSTKELINDLKELDSFDVKKEDNSNIINSETVSNSKDKYTYNNGYKKIFIGIIGVSFGVGVTHISIMLANYLSKKNKVAVIEMNNSNDLNEICCDINQEKIKGQNIFRHKKVEYFINMDYSEFLATYRDKYDYIILDFGSYSELLNLDEFIRADIRCVVGHGMDWKIKELTYFYKTTKEYDKNNSWKYLIPFIDKKYFTEIKEMVSNKIYSIPFNMNPFMPSIETKNISESIKLIGGKYGLW